MGRGRRRGRGAPQTPLFSTYLSLGGTMSATIFETFSRTVGFWGAPPMTPLRTGNSPPNARVGRVAARIARGRNILNRRRGVRCRRASSFPGFIWRLATRPRSLTSSEMLRLLSDSSFSPGWLDEIPFGPLCTHCRQYRVEKAQSYPDSEVS